MDYGAGSAYACESQLSAAVTLKKEQEQVTNCLEPSSKPNGIKSVQSRPLPEGTVSSDAGKGQICNMEPYSFLYDMSNIVSSRATDAENQ